MSIIYSYSSVFNWEQTKFGIHFKAFRNRTKCFRGDSISSEGTESPQLPTMSLVASVPHLVAVSLPLQVLLLHTAVAQRRHPSLGLYMTTCSCSVEVKGFPLSYALCIYPSWKLCLLLHFLQQNFLPWKKSFFLMPFKLLMPSEVVVKQRHCLLMIKVMLLFSDWTIIKRQRGWVVLSWSWFPSYHPNEILFPVIIELLTVSGVKYYTPMPMVRSLWCIDCFQCVYLQVRSSSKLITQHTANVGCIRSGLLIWSFLTGNVRDNLLPFFASSLCPGFIQGKRVGSSSRCTSLLGGRASPLHSLTRKSLSVLSILLLVISTVGSPSPSLGISVANSFPITFSLVKKGHHTAYTYF